LEHAGRLEARGEPYGIPVTVLDGNDVLAIHDAAEKTVAAVRGGTGPQILFMQTYRLGPHSKGDDLRDPKEIAERAKIAGIPRARAGLDAAWCAEVDAAVAAEVAAVVQAIRQSRLAAQ
jgi:TPP-dependent pyruvate/acetoin dehydrogenase alpha subunit